MQKEHITVIYENFVVKNIYFVQSDEKLLRENFFTSITIYDEYMARIDMNENIITQKFLTQKFYATILM